MTARSFALLSALRRRRRERGAAVFVVVLVISLLTALGVYAVKTATLSNRASGYNRQLVQTHYVTELGMVAAVADLKGSLHDTYWLLKNRVPDPGAGDAVCEAHYDQEFPECVLLSYDDLNTLATNSTGQALLRPNAAGAHGSLGPANLETDIRVEITDPHDMAPPSGFQVAGGVEDPQGQVFALVTVTVTGLVMPPPDAGAPPTDRFDLQSASAAGIERQRAHVRMGPLLAQR